VLLGLLALLAFAVREQFVLSAIVDMPIRGDVRDYVAYALNLVEHGVYGGTYPPALPTPDSYRLPGYPWLLALGMQVWPQVGTAQLGGWYTFVLQAQVVLGAATCVLVALLVREWAKPAWALFAGLLIALWPHHVAATGALLSEVVFGFCLVLAMFAFARAWATRRTGWFVLAGVAFGYAYLVNPLVLLFPPVLALLVALRGERRGAAWLLALFLVPVVGFALRSAQLPDNGQSSAGRAQQNFVQGSWPMYHAAATHAGRGIPQADAIMAEIDAETRTLQQDTGQGLRRVGARLAGDPVGYARWYLGKPWLLWDWRIRFGDGIYVLDVRNSPLERNPVLRTLVATWRALNPVASVLCLAGALLLGTLGWRSRDGVPAAALALLVLYLTAVHVVLQAEPRYAIAYRGLECALVVTVLAWLAARVAARGTR
jgi:hypothetical protein